MLTQTQVKALKPGDKPFKVTDGAGLYLYVATTGAKSWRANYRHDGRQLTRTFGLFPEIGLADAREAHAAFKAALRRGEVVSPRIFPSSSSSVLRGLEEGAPLFGDVAERYIAIRRKKSASPATLEKLSWLLSSFGELRARPIADLAPKDFVRALQPIDDAGAHEKANRMRVFAGQVMRYSVSLDLRDTDPTTALRDMLILPQPRKRPGVTDALAFGRLLLDIEGYAGGTSTYFALNLAPLLVLRSRELRHLSLDDLDLDAMIIRVPDHHMKMKVPFAVPLSRQAADLLRRAVSAPRPHASRLIFPGQRPGRPLSENTLNAALRTLGYDKHTHVLHGFRTSFSTMMNERDHRDRTLHEIALSHRIQGVEGHYNEARYVEPRRPVMQAWSDLCDGMKAAARPG